MMDFLNGLLAGFMIGAAILFVLHCPIFKPWFGFRRPPGHRGHWFE
jgi:hypothetical protein